MNIFLCLTCSAIFSAVSSSDLEIIEDLFARSTGNNSVHGFPVRRGQHPHAIVFYEKTIRQTTEGDFLSPIASGTIVASRWVLTTAVPLGNYAIDTIFMVAGLPTITNDPQQVLNCTKNVYEAIFMIVHPKWHVNIHNNVGLVKTNKHFMLGIGIGILHLINKFDISENDVLICDMVIWSLNSKRNLLLDHLQPLPITKEILNFKLGIGSIHCSELNVDNKLWCLMQEDPYNRKDVCKINVGSAIMCNCGVVGIFVGIQGIVDCVDVPPLKYTAIRLNYHLEWIRNVILNK